MNTFKVIIEYDGTFFHGWQIQKKGERTVQDEVKKAIKMLLNQDITVFGSGRTDRGVHAAGQVAHFKTSINIDCDKFQYGLNAILPKDIVITNIKKVPKNFHAQYSVKTKTYRYIILNRKTRTVFSRNIMHHYPYPLDIKAMKKASELIVGTKDFRAFTATRRNPDHKKQTVRTIKKIEIKKSKNFITFDIEADGFLYKMARNIIGTLIFVGSGKISPESICHILKSKKRSLAGPTAPANGLQLLKVKY